MIVDSFAGGGGASTGIEAALGGRPIEVAINHSPAAIAMHRANHPRTLHYCESVFDVDPATVADGRPVELLWASPDCTHFSRAKGTQPLKNEIRGLAWVVVDWARAVRPAVIMLENVEEFRTWGPLDRETGRPVAAAAGETFREWLEALRAIGYAVEWRSLVAADYGTPTTRRRLFLIARCDGQPIVWPERTHGKGTSSAWRPAAEVIDWSLPCPSIFSRKRPLAPATLRRIARGIERYVLGVPEPFVIKYHGGEGWRRGQRLDEPLRTVDGANRFALVNPFLVRHGHYSTITGAGLIEGCGAGTFRGQSLEQPLATVCATNDKHLVAPIITKHYGDPDRASGGGAVVGHELTRTLGTVTARDHHALTCAFLAKFYGTSSAAPMQLPLPTVTGGGGRGGGHLALVMVHGEPYAITDIGMRMLQPHELFAAQGFPSDYVLAPELDGRPLNKSQQIKLAGNSVCPQVAEALVAVNLGERARAAS